MSDLLHIENLFGSKGLHLGEVGRQTMAASRSKKTEKLRKLAQEARRRSSARSDR